MSASTALAERLAWRHAWTRPSLTLLGLVLMLGLLMHEEVSRAVETWLSSTAYNHCLLVFPFAAYLAWQPQRRAALRLAKPEPTTRWALFALPLAVVWLASERLGIMEGRQFVTIAMLQVLVLCVLGVPAWKSMAAPLLYLFFLVPFGSFATPWLQGVTVWFVVHGLSLLGIHYINDGMTISIPEGRFYVAEACAGLRFLIASFAFGTLYACVLYRTVSRRLACMAVFTIVPIIANGGRALGIVVLGHVLGSAEAAATDHLVYGWLFFCLVTTILIMAGLPFQQNQQIRKPDVWTPATDRSPITSGLVALVLFGVTPLFVLTLNLSSSRTLVPVTPEFVGNEACFAFSESEFMCDGVRLKVWILKMPARINPGQMLASLRSASGEMSSDEARNVPITPSPWRLVTTVEPLSARAYAFWLDGKPASTGLHTRLQQAGRSLMGGSGVPMVATVSVLDKVGAQTAQSAIEHLLQGQADLSHLSQQPA